MLARSEYLARHNSKRKESECKMDQEKWTGGHVSENSQAKLLWNFSSNDEKSQHLVSQM